MNNQMKEEIVVLVRQLTKQGQIRMALLILEAYFIREWKQSEEIALYYARRYLMKNYPKQVAKFRQRIADANSNGGMPNAKQAGIA